MMTGRKVIGLTAVLLALALTLDAQVKDRAEVLLQAAIKQELVEGDLKGAIEQFKKIAQNSNPEVAAEALVHLAACYDMLGQADARNVYERIVREYPTQKRAVTEARAWLDAHLVNARPQVGIRVEQVWTGPGVDLEGRVSPDGRYLTFADWTDGPANLAVRDLKTGEIRLLTRDATWNGYAAESLVSPDGKQIAYRWEGSKDDSIRLIGVDGTRMRVLARREYGDFLAAWSPNGRHIAAVHYNLDDKTTEIVLISTVDGSMTQLKSTGWRSGTLGGFSPDGRFLVYSLKKDPTAGSGVFTLATDGSGETPLVQGSANEDKPVWSPDGHSVIFISDRSGTNGLWSIRVAGGQAEGSAELIRANIGNIFPMGFTGDGSFYYGTQNLQTDAYTAEFDSGTLTIKKPMLVMDRFVGSNFEPELSPDGKYVAFFRRPSETAAGGPAMLIVRSSTSGEERILANLDIVYSGDRNLQWFPDSRSVLLESTTNNRKTFRQINVETGEARVLFEGPYEIWRTAALSPDGRALFYSVFERGSRSDVGILRLVKRRLETGDETELYRTQSEGIGFFGLTVSPDDSRLAFSVNVADNKRALMIMPADGGKPREIYRTGYDGLSPQGAMIWSKDGRHVVVTAKGPGEDQQLCAISTEGGELKPLGLRMQQIQTRMISADSRRIAFTGATRKRELWVSRNLLPDPAKAR